MSINNLFAVLDCQPTTPNRLRGEARNGRRAIYVDRSRRPDGDLRDKPGCVPASGCTKGAPSADVAQIDRAISATSSRDFAPFAPHSRRRPGPPQIAEEVARARLSGFQPVLLRQKPGRGTAGFLEDRLEARRRRRGSSCRGPKPQRGKWSILRWLGITGGSIPHHQPPLPLPKPQLHRAYRRVVLS